MRALRFGIVAESVRDGPAWADHARAAEEAGVGSLLLRDHFSAGAFGQQLAPFSALAAAVWQMPTIYVGSPAQICDDLASRRERFGLSYLVTSDHDLPALSTVIAGL